MMQYYLNEKPIYNGQIRIFKSEVRALDEAILKKVQIKN